MKKLLMAMVLAAGVTAFGETKYVDPNPFNDYGKAMSHQDGYQMAYEWQRADAAKVEAATREEVVAAFVADEAAAKALLGQLKGAYATDGIVMTQIAAVTQWVMLADPWYCLFWDGPHAAGRAIWKKALTEMIATATDDYVRTFCRQQLDLCE